MNEMKSWERQPNETDPAFAAFKCYLGLDERSVEKVAKKLSKSASLLYRWAGQNNWKERAIAYDNSLLEEVRQDIRRTIAQEVKRQWKDSVHFQKLSAEALKSKDLSRASVKSLNELYHAAVAHQWELVDRLKLDETDDSIKIEIVDAMPKADAKDAGD